MKRFLYFLSVTILIPAFLYGQKPLPSEINSKADEIVIQLTNREYFDHLTRDSIPVEWDYIRLDSTIFYPKTYSVLYFLKNRDEFNNMHIINEFGGIGPAGILVELNDKLELIEPGTFSMESWAQRQLRAFEKFKTTDLISKDKAENSADNYFPDNVKKPDGYSLFLYDSNTDLFLWRFEKFKGFRKGIIEEVFIDAESGRFVRKEATPFTRSFWQALFHYRRI